MRKIDKQKLSLVNEAIIKLSAQGNLVDLSMGKIAKEAGVSPSTLYIYYDNKKEMLSEIYMLAKTALDKNVAEALESQTDGFMKLQTAMRQFSKNVRDSPEKLLFLLAMQGNLSLLNQTAQDFSTSATKRVLAVCHDLITRGQAKPLSDEILAAVLTSALFQVLAAQLDKSAVDSVISVTLDGLKI